MIRKRNWIVHQSRLIMSTMDYEEWEDREVVVQARTRNGAINAAALQPGGLWSWNSVVKV